MDIMRFITETNIKINVEKKGEKKFFFIQLTCTHYTLHSIYTDGNCRPETNTFTA